MGFGPKVSKIGKKYPKTKPLRYLKIEKVTEIHYIDKKDQF